VRKLFEAGALITLNTDDPGISGITLSDEFEKAVTKFNFSFNEIKQLVLNAVSAAFVPEEQKRKLRRSVRREFVKLRIWLEAKSATQRARDGHETRRMTGQGLFTAPAGSY